MIPTLQPKRQKATPTSAKHTMLTVKQLAFVAKHESCDHPNNQRATDEQYHD